jgi:hypothetical protein
MLLYPLAVASAAILATAAVASIAVDKVIGQNSASGVNAQAQAEGNAKKPKALFVQVEATAGQTVRVNWYMACNYPAFEVQDRKGVINAQAPFKRKLPFPKKDPLKCGLSVSASIAEGDVSLTLLSRK